MEPGRELDRQNGCPSVWGVSFRRSAIKRNFRRPYSATALNAAFNTGDIMHLKDCVSSAEKDSAIFEDLDWHGAHPAPDFEVMSDLWRVTSGCGPDGE